VPLKKLAAILFQTAVADTPECRAAAAASAIEACSAIFFSAGTDYAHHKVQSVCRPARHREQEGAAVATAALRAQRLCHEIQFRVATEKENVAVPPGWSRIYARSRKQRGDTSDASSPDAMSSSRRVLISPGAVRRQKRRSRFSAPLRG